MPQSSSLHNQWPTSSDYGWYTPGDPAWLTPSDYGRPTLDDYAWSIPGDDGWYTPGDPAWPIPADHRWPTPGGSTWPIITRSVTTGKTSHTCALSRFMVSFQSRGKTVDTLNTILQVISALIIIAGFISFLHLGCALVSFPPYNAKPRPPRNPDDPFYKHLDGIEAVLIVVAFIVAVIWGLIALAS